MLKEDKKMEEPEVEYNSQMYRQNSSDFSMYVNSLKWKDAIMVNQNGIQIAYPIEYKWIIGERTWINQEIKEKYENGLSNYKNWLLGHQGIEFESNFV